MENNSLYFHFFFFFKEKEIKRKVLYQKSDTAENVFVNSALLLPLNNLDNKMIGVLEISNMSYEGFGFDEEYFAIVFLNFLTDHLEKLSLINFNHTEIR